MHMNTRNMWFIATSRSIVLRGSVSMMSGTSMYLNGGLEPSETHPPAQQSSGHRNTRSPLRTPQNWLGLPLSW